MDLCEFFERVGKLQCFDLCRKVGNPHASAVILVEYVQEESALLALGFNEKLFGGNRIRVLPASEVISKVRTARLSNSVYHEKFERNVEDLITKRMKSVLAISSDSVDSNSRDSDILSLSISDSHSHRPKLVAVRKNDGRRSRFRTRSRVPSRTRDRKRSLSSARSRSRSRGRPRSKKVKGGRYYSNSRQVEL